MRSNVVFGMIAGCLLGSLSVGMASAAGARALYQRLERVAQHVCPEASGRNLQTLDAARRCEKQALARAVHQINSPRLAEVYASSANSGRSASAT